MNPAKTLFVPVGIASGLVAGLVAKKLYDLTWQRISADEAPGPEQREVSMPKLAASLALEGAIFGVSRGMVDHLARTGFLRATGAWPGDEDE
ncbi:MAG TPA: DUF4235 domain-containing protein [Solirubrobacterales bacterium]|nr:DUF4235 domain-containing protein [Solirubrobacterales bacterium]